MKLPKSLRKKNLTKRVHKLHKLVAKRLKKSKRKNIRRNWIFVTIGVFVITAFGYSIWNNLQGSMQNTERLITFHDRGKNHVILTDANTVRAALEDANISVSPQDIVEPVIDSTLVSSDSAVIIYRSRPVLVIDGAYKQKIVTAAASPNEITTAIGLPALTSEDKSTITEGSIIADGASHILTIERSIPPDPIAANKPTVQTLTPSKGAQIFVDSNGVAHRETYYDLPMNIVIQHCGPGDYTVRYDGAKVDKDGYVLVAASYRNYPKCSIVETSMGLGKVYDTGGFALRYPHGFDLATDWTNNNGR